MDISYEEMERQIRERDEADANRALAPMRAAEGGVEVDTSDMDVSQVVERLIGMAQSHGG
jgi:cytidylate kinase